MPLLKFMVIGMHFILSNTLMIAQKNRFGASNIPPRSRKRDFGVARVLNCKSRISLRPLAIEKRTTSSRSTTLLSNQNCRAGEVDPLTGSFNDGASLRRQIESLGRTRTSTVLLRLIGACYASMSQKGDAEAHIEGCIMIIKTWAGKRN